MFGRVAYRGSLSLGFINEFRFGIVHLSIKRLPEISREDSREGNLYCLKASINLSQNFQTSISLCHFGGKHSLIKCRYNAAFFFSGDFLIPEASWEVKLSSVQSGCCHHQLPARKWIIEVSNDIVLLNSPPCPAWSCRPSPALQALPGSCSHGLAINRKNIGLFPQLSSNMSIHCSASKTYRTVSGINPNKVGAGECGAHLAFPCWPGRWSSDLLARQCGCLKQ